MSIKEPPITITPEGGKLRLDLPATSIEAEDVEGLLSQVDDMVEAIKSGLRDAASDLSLRQIENNAPRRATLERLAARLRRTEAKLEKIVRAPIVVPISTLAPEPFEIVGPIHAVIQENDGSFIASFPEANLGASGETKAEALDGLKDRIVTTFERLDQKPDAKLGPGPLHQKHVLNSLIRRR